MMQQSETFTPHTSISANGGVDTEPTDLDLVEVFESSGKNAIMKLGDKKKFMIRIIFNNSKDLIEKAIILDTAIIYTITSFLLTLSFFIHKLMLRRDKSKINENIKWDCLVGVDDSSQGYQIEKCTFTFLNMTDVKCYQSQLEYVLNICHVERCDGTEME